MGTDFHSAAPLVNQVATTMTMTLSLSSFLLHLLALLEYGKDWFAPWRIMRLSGIPGLSLRQHYSLPLGQHYNLYKKIAIQCALLQVGTHPDVRYDLRCR